MSVNGKVLMSLVMLAIFVTMVGGVILFVSVAREKWFIYRSDPYKDVQR